MSFHVRTRIAIVLLCCTILLGNSVRAQTDSDEEIRFVYIRRNYDSENQLESVTIETVGLDDTKQHVVEVSGVRYYSLSSTGPYVAIAEHNGLVSVIDLDNQQVVPLSIPIALDSNVIYDDYSIQSGSLHWSQNGSLLAYVGKNESNEAGIYLYDVENDEQVYLTEGIDFQNSLDITSWSPNGQWVSIAGLQNTDDTQGLSRQASFISIRTYEVIVVPSKFDASCRFIWSPNADYVATTTACYTGLAGQSNLIWFEFSQKNIANQTIQQVVKKNDANYEHPFWTDEYSLAVVSHDEEAINQKVFNVRSEDVSQLSTGEDSYSGTSFSQNWRYTFRLNDAGQRIISGYSMGSDDTNFNLEPMEDACLVRYVKGLPSQNLVAILRGCMVNSTSTIEIYDYSTNRLLSTIDSNVNEQLEPIGFVQITER